MKLFSYYAVNILTAEAEGKGMEEFVKKRIREVLKGERDAFAEIVELYKDKVYLICYRMLGNTHEAEDLTQETFLRAYVNIDRYNINRKFSTWIYRIATNLCIDRIRKKKPDFSLDAQIKGTDGLTMYSQLSSPRSLPEDEVVEMEIQDIVQKAIMNLPEKYRTVVVLKYIEELSLQEIAEILEMPIGTVKTRLYRGREALRKQLRHI